MSNLFWLSEEQMERLAPLFPKSHGKPRVDDRSVLGGIIFINHNCLHWCDAPREYGPPKTLYIAGSGGVSWGLCPDDGGACLRGGDQKAIMIDATYPKRTAQLRDCGRKRAA